MNLLQWRVAKWLADVALCWDRLLECILGPSPAKMMREAMIGGLEEGLREWAEEEERMNQEEHNGFNVLPNALALLREAAQRWRPTYDIGQAEDGRYYVYDHALGTQAVLPFNGADYDLLTSIHDGSFQRPLMILANRRDA